MLDRILAGIIRGILIRILGGIPGGTQTKKKLKSILRGISGRILGENRESIAYSDSWEEYKNGNIVKISGKNP